MKLSGVPVACVSCFWTRQTSAKLAPKSRLARMPPAKGRSLEPETSEAYLLPRSTCCFLLPRSCFPTSAFPAAPTASGFFVSADSQASKPCFGHCTGAEEDRTTRQITAARAQTTMPVQTFNIETGSAESRDTRAQNRHCLCIVSSHRRLACSSPRRSGANLVGRQLILM